MSNIGKTIWSRNHTESGLVVNASTRYCAACCQASPCLIVKWAGGNKTKPCLAGIKYLPNGDLEIM